MSAIETLGETFQNLIFEAVSSPSHPGDLQIHTWNGHHSTTTSQLKCNGASFLPMKLSTGLVQLVRFAPPSMPFGSTSKLVSALRDFFSKYIRLQPEVVDLLTAFALATWFCDFLSMAPVLYLFGPDDAVSTVLRLLSCVCRRAVRLGDIDIAGLATLPGGLNATLLLNQKDIGRRVRQTLLTSTRRHFAIVRGNGRLNLFGARVFAGETLGLEGPGFKGCLSPAQDSLRILTDSEEEVMAQNFQSKLLRYRMARYRAVRDRQVDCSEFFPTMREQALTWLAPICDCPELSKAVFAEILQQSQEAAGARLVDPKYVVTEGALFFCHKRDLAHFFVGELAETVNLLLKGRHEEPSLSAKGVGLMLRELGLHGERVAEGYKVVLTDMVRQRIHQLARDYQVASLQDGVRRCRFCSGEAASKRIQ
jgi:hypothetical protein